MATNTTIPPEEEKKPLTPPADYQPTTFAQPAPTATYEGSDQAAIMQQMIADYVNRTDPQAQAEQDARTQRGRNFWTGANLFANVIANAINAGGTAKGAPSMTWNDSQQKMFDTWQTADRELKADRKAAQQRLEALRMQDAQLRMADAQARDKAAADAYTRNWQAENEAGKLNAGNARRDYEWERGQQADAAKTKAGQDFQLKMEGIRNANQRARQQEGFEHQENMVEKRAQMAKGYNKGTKTIRIGNTDFKAETEAEADSNIAQVYGMVLAAYNKQFTNPMQQQAFDGKPENEYSFINAHINQLYASDPDFKAQYDAWANQHKRSVSSNQQSNSQQNNNSNNQGNGGESGLF